MLWRHWTTLYPKQWSALMRTARFAACLMPWNASHKASHT
jgi:hypothetical protein